MYCKNCKKEIEDDSKFCVYCSTKVEPKEVVLGEVGTNRKIADDKKITKTIGLLVFILGVISFILFFKASNSIFTYAEEMSFIRSEAGTSINEAYYQDMGQIIKGLSIFIKAIGVTALSFSLGIGTILYKK